MAFEALKNSSLPSLVGETVTDFADLVQKEFELARAEISEKISNRLGGAGFLISAGLVGLLGFAVLLQALILGIASYGIALHFSAAIVGGAVLLFAGALYLIGRAKMSEPFTPTRTINQVKQDLRVVKERLQ